MDTCSVWLSHGEVIQGKACGVLRRGDPAGADSGTAGGGQVRGSWTLHDGAVPTKSASKDKHGHPSASGPRLGRVPDPQTLQPPGSPQTPSATWLGVRAGSWEAGLVSEGCSLSAPPSF